MKLPISKRLLCVAAQVPKGARVADIGCDHGYLSLYLLQSGRADFVHACDLREKPLATARENAARFGISEGLRLSCADGLRAVDPAAVDTVVCAGMGGDLIAQLLSAAPWIRDERYLLILQPQSGGSDLRRYLTESGFGTVREELTEDGGFLYNVICARFGNAVPLSAGEQYIPPCLLHGGSPLLPRYLERIENALRLTVEGISHAAAQEDRAKLTYYQTALREVRAFRAAIDDPKKEEHYADGSDRI